MRAQRMALQFFIKFIRPSEIWRSKHVMPTQLSEPLSIYCRGEPIGREDLFKYTNGRFLVREKEQIDARYLEFDIDQLCAIAASIGSSKSPIYAIEKTENGFGKILLITKEDGSELVVKLPYAGPSKYTTASEAAVLQYLYDHTKVPVPKLLAWSADASSNPVGAEYVIMEKAAGCQLTKKWDEMDEEGHVQLVKNLCRLESELAAIAFPAYGSLYLREFMDDDKYEPLAPELDPFGRFCIGPSCRKNETESVQARFNQGPWLTLQAFGIALVERGITCIEQNPRPYESNKPLRGSNEEQLAILKMAESIFSKMDSQTAPGQPQVAQPTLWHNDLHMGNIFVSNEDPTQIVSLINWEQTVVWPLFYQVRFPMFIDVGNDYELGSKVPTLLEDQMDDDSQAIARHKNEVVRMAKAYEHGCSPDVFEALRVPTVFANLISHYERVWKEGAVPIRNCVLEISKAWNHAGFSGDCLEFSKDDMKKYKDEAKLYQTHQNVLALAQKALDTDPNGWIHPSEDFEEKQKRNKEVLEMLLAGCAEERESPERVLPIWPFLPSFW